MRYARAVPRNPQPPQDSNELPDDYIRPLKRSELEFLKGGAQPGPTDPHERDSSPKLPGR